VTPDEVIEIAPPPPAPPGMDWRLLTAEDLVAMPVLRELKAAPARPRRDE